MTSISPSVESRSPVAVTGQPSNDAGMSVGGATSTTSAPSAVKASTFERATRECLMSPTIAMRSPFRSAGTSPSR